MLDENGLDCRLAVFHVVYGLFCRTASHVKKAESKSPKTICYLRHILLVPYHLGIGEEKTLKKTKKKTAESPFVPVQGIPTVGELRTDDYGFFSLFTESSSYCMLAANYPVYPAL
jgi:hypothetical protein